MTVMSHKSRGRSFLYIVNKLRGSTDLRSGNSLTPSHDKGQTAEKFEPSKSKWTGRNTRHDPQDLCGRHRSNLDLHIQTFLITDGPASGLAVSKRISAVFKKGDRNKAENYRPVSLTSVVC